MANPVEGCNNFPSRPFRLCVNIEVTMQSGNASLVHWKIIVRKNSYSPTYGGSWQVSIALNGGQVGATSGSSFNFVNGDAWVILEGDNWLAHNSSGNLHIQADGWASYALLGATSVTVHADAPQIQRGPSAPGAPSASNVTPTSLRMCWSAPADTGSSGITQYEWWVWNPGGASYAAHGYTSSTCVDVTGLTPGAQYALQVRAQNATNWGDYSGYGGVTMLPSGAPSLTVTPAPTGTSATVAFTPPSGVTGVDSYTVTATYTAPAPIPSPATRTFTTTSNSLVATGLTPGATYSWTATATIGSYTTPPTSPAVVVVQPRPNTRPGDYFDGSTADTVDVDYAWTGTADNSTSTATGAGVDGWQALGSNVALYRATGGYVGSFSAFLRIMRDATAAGVKAGQANVDGKRTPVEPGTMYVGSMYIQPSRDQSMVATLTWVNASGGAVGTESLGNVTLAPAGVWTRLIVADNAPAGAAYGLIRVQDAAGPGWSLWLAGQSLRMDAAMITLGAVFPYFDGDTPDVGGYDYSWQGDPNASISQRNSLSIAYDPLDDPDCVNVPAPPRPPTVPSTCIVDIGVWRRYWAYIPAAEVSDWLTMIPTLVLSTFSAPERQVRIRFYADPFGRPNTEVDASGYCSEQIISYIPPAAQLTLDGVTERVWATVNNGAPIGADHLLYGSDGAPAEWPHLSCGIGYWVSFDVPNEAPSGNLSVRVLMTERV